MEWPDGLDIAMALALRMALAKFSVWYPDKKVSLEKCYLIYLVK